MLFASLGPRARAAILRLQARARGAHVRAAYAYLRNHNRPMGRWAFWSLAMFFVCAKVELTLCLLVALSDKFTDWTTLPPTRETGEHFTPFQQHPHNWGVLFQLMVAAHVITGSTLVVSLIVPLCTEKGGKLHRVFGRVFASVWVFHMIDGLWNASTVILNRGYNEELYPQSDEDGFSLHLFLQFGFVAGVLCEYLVAGLAAPQFKLAAPRWFRHLMVTMTYVSTMHCISMVAVAVLTFINMDTASDTAVEYAIIFCLDFPVYLFQTLKNYNYYAHSDPTYNLYGWPVEHQRNMMFVCNFTLITGIANLTFRIAPWATVALFATQEVTWVAWILIKEKKMKQALASAFVGRRRRARATAISAALLLSVGSRGPKQPGSGGSSGSSHNSKDSTVVDVDEIDAAVGAILVEDDYKEGAAVSSKQPPHTSRLAPSRQWQGERDARTRAEYLLELARRAGSAAHGKSHGSLVEV